MFFKSLILSLFFVNVNVFGQSEDKPSFRIVAPQFICKGQSELPSPSQITIRMQTRGGQKLLYTIKIYFHLLGPFRNQQHSLSIWQSVRKLEKKLRDEFEIISIKNQINIQNNELTSGVFYIFNIMGSNSNGIQSESQNFTIIYRGGANPETQQEGTSTTDDVSLLLIGAEVLAGNMELIAEAKSIFCTPTNDFYVKWDMTNLRNNIDKKYLLTRGKTMKIPAGILRGGDTHELSAEIIGSGDVSLTKATMRLTVLKKGFITTIAPESMMLGINKDFEIRVFSKDMDNTGEEFTYQWTCRNIKLNILCDDFISTKNETQLLTFLTQGEYEINATVSLNGRNKILTSKIIVNSLVIANADIKNIPTIAIPANKPFTLQTTVRDLVPNCVIEWTVTQENGFAYFNSSEIIGGLGNLTIRDVEETILSELVDYGNDTVTRDMPLIIPARLINDTWKGLENNVKYKFRLLITCPEPIDDTNKNKSKNITSFTDVIIETNGPPQPLPLEVTPQSGISLRTIFKFSTGIANDTVTDYPLKYSFKYIVDGYVINLGELYENMVTTTDLPYSKLPIQTILRVCDSRSACSDDIRGPNITTILISNISDEEFKYKKGFIQKSMADLEFDAGFGTALTCLLTFKEMDNKKYLAEMQDIITNSIKDVIKKINNNKLQILKSDIINFVKLSKQNLDIIKLNDVELYRELLQLMELTLKGNTRFVEFTNNNERYKRANNVNTNNNNIQNNIVDKNFVDMLLDLTVRSIQPYENNKDAKVELDFTIKVHQYMELLCQNMAVNTEFFNKSIVAFELSRIDRQQIFLTNYSVPSNKYNNPAYIFINRNTQFKPKKKYCIGKARFPSDYLTSSEENNNPIYEFVILENGTIIQLKNEVESILVDIPFIIDSSQNIDYSCALYEEPNWKTDKCQVISLRNNRIQCHCSNIGYLKIVTKIRPTQKTKLPTITTTPETIRETTEMNIEKTSGMLINSSTYASSTSTLTSVTKTTLTTSIPKTVSSTKITLTPVTEASTINVLTSSVTTTFTTLTAVNSQTKNSNILDEPKTATPKENKNNENPETGPTGTAIGYSTIGLLALAAIGGVIFGIVFKRRKQRHNVVQETEILNSQFRRPSPGIKYARFHDEQNMFGDFQDYSVT